MVHGRRSRCHSVAASVVLLLPLVTQGCASPTAAVDVEGKLDVLGPTVEFAAGPRGDWVAEGTFERNQAVVVENEKIPALRVAAGPRAFVLARRTQAYLLATPYLTWAWNIEDHGRGIHPIRLVVGFWGGAPDSVGRKTEPFAWLGRRLPRHDRALAIGWADSALQRGNLDIADADKPHAPLYIVRGGRENVGRWWVETVDLSHLYRQAWPDDDAGRASVSFIGVAAAPGTAASLISGLRLSR